ncbi:MAG: CAP domain-containing protein [Limimaricola sp.]|uniref:CAP domain-containing protein n=1 Tax=Limimaricola sp. TaxID=2211665 RepID=UPI001D98EA46|nr:CAP domain-containing protein [Limimaricola sp.]MBI1416290.1 CAP domain-containing protein [Limimaricola sp.]
MKIAAKLCAATCLLFAAATAAEAGGCSVPGNAQAMASQIAAGLNAQRAANGLPALRYNPTLSQAAMAHACDMTEHDFFSHRGSDGSTAGARMRRVGYRFCTAAENIAWGYPHPDQIISGWMASPGHRHNMLLQGVTDFGIAIAQSPKGPYWVLDIASHC